MPKRIEETSNRYGRLLVLYKVPKRAQRGGVTWGCLCECGRMSLVIGGGLRSGDTRSCGCLQKEVIGALNRTHGLRSVRVYKALTDAILRCENTENDYYKNYGGRGISVCRKWKRNPQTFVDWASANGYRRGLELDRIDNNGDYEPGNCRFVTSYVNMHNKKRLMSTNKSGYAGVSLDKKSDMWEANIGSKTFTGRKSKRLGMFPTPWLACKARNEFILKNNLPHRVQEETI